MTEDRKRTWDVVLGIAAPILTVAGILAGVWQFNAGEKNRTTLESQLVAQKDQVEFNRKLWLERLNAYRSLAELVGKIVAHTDDAKFKTLAKDFTAAYWGTMILVEDVAVERAMKDFYLILYDYQNGYADHNKLKLGAEQLVKACRESAERHRQPVIPKATNKSP